MRNELVRSRAHRVLGSLERYEAAIGTQHGPFRRLAVLETGEELIGVYTNTEDADLLELGITSNRLILCYADGRIDSVKYAEIRWVTLEGEKCSSRFITTLLTDGTSKAIEISGGDGRFRDTMAFMRFLDRVVEDLRRSVDH